MNCLRQIAKTASNPSIRRNTFLSLAKQPQQQSLFRQQQQRPASAFAAATIGTSTSTTTTATRFLSSNSTVSGFKDSYENILIEQPNDKVVIVKLNRPKALNALNNALFEDLFHATTVINNDNAGHDFRCMILTGSTPKAFAAGADISEMCQKTYEEVARPDMFAEWQQLTKLSKQVPIIAAVSGYCLGGGCEVAMMCDIMICDESAKFGQPEINLGVIPGAGGTQRLTRAIGKSKSMYMNLTGDFLSAQEAYQSGLVAKVYKDHDELVEQSIAMATKIASKGKLAIQAVKEAVNAADELPLQEGLRLERRLFHSLFATTDQKEGMTAFLEKRPAQFK